ncbi:MAG: hypothetical protein Q8K55_16170 [Gemmatimonadaceae bacterium]|nr:hypothetical protein [Gemmatimonadaceae bacterium]
MPTPSLPQTALQAPSPPGVTGTSVLPQNVSRPMTREDVQLLQNRRSELSRQLTSATGRRSEVVREMGRNVNGREGLESRLTVLDERIVQLEKDIAQNGQLLASAPSNLVEETLPPSMMVGPIGGRINVNDISIALIFAIGLPLAIAYSVRTLRRGARAVAAFPSAVAERIARIENAVDTIALEVERISEGQRFVTKLMSETNQLGAGAAEPIVLRQGEKVPLERPDAR